MFGEKHLLREAGKDMLRMSQIEDLQVCRHCVQGKMCSRYSMEDADVRVSNTETRGVRRNECRLKHPRYVNDMDILHLVQCHSWSRRICMFDGSARRCHKMHATMEAMQTRMTAEDRVGHLWVAMSSTYQMTTHLVQGDAVWSSFRDSTALCSPLYFPANEYGLIPETEAPAGAPTSSHQRARQGVESTSSERTPLPATSSTDAGPGVACVNMHRQPESVPAAATTAPPAIPTANRMSVAPSAPLTRMDLIDRMNLDMQLTMQGSDSDVYDLLISWWRVLFSSQEVFNTRPRTREYSEYIIHWIEANLALIMIPETERFRQQQTLPEPRVRWV